MQLIKMLLTKANRCVTDGRILNPIEGLTLHSVGVNQPLAVPFYNAENQPASNAAVHAVVQADGKVYQFLPWTKRGWHCGAGKFGSYNNTHIGVEMTEPAGIRYTGGATWEFTNETAAREHIKGTYKTAVELFAYLCTEFELDPLAPHVIVSHAEAAAEGMAYPHADVEHIWDKVGLTMDQFRKDVKAAMNPYTAADALKVNLLYATLLGREPDEAGRESWLKVLKQDGFEATYSGIANSREGRKYFVKCLYRSMLGRAGKASEINYWAEFSREQIYKGITGSDEYKKKHS